MSDEAVRQHYKLATGKPLQGSPPPTNPKVVDRSAKSAGGSVYGKGGKVRK